LIEFFAYFSDENGMRMRVFLSLWGLFLSVGFWVSACQSQGTQESATPPSSSPGWEGDVKLSPEQQNQDLLAMAKEVVSRLYPGTFQGEVTLGFFEMETVAGKEFYELNHGPAEGLLEADSLVERPSGVLVYREQWGDALAAETRTDFHRFNVVLLSEVSPLNDPEYVFERQQVDGTAHYFVGISPLSRGRVKSYAYEGLRNPSFYSNTIPMLLIKQSHLKSPESFHRIWRALP
jgi:hypothetical protein